MSDDRQPFDVINDVKTSAMNKLKKRPDWSILKISVLIDSTPTQFDLEFSIQILRIAKNFAIFFVGSDFSSATKCQ